MTGALTFEGWSDPMVLYLCQNMRAGDMAEIFCQRPEVDAYALYRDMANLGPLHLWFEVARPSDSHIPVALFGMVQTGPGIGVAHMFGTDELTLDHARQIADRVRNVATPIMIDRGIHRVEALSLENYHWAHRFLRRAGARVEGPRAALGKNGENFTCFVWLKKEITNVFDA